MFYAIANTTIRAVGGAVTPPPPPTPNVVNSFETGLLFTPLSKTATIWKAPLLQTNVIE